MAFSADFRNRMVQRMVGRNGVTAASLAREVGLGMSTLCRWRQEARMTRGRSEGGEGENRAPKSPRMWSADEKVRAVAETMGLTGEELGAYLRREGLHEAQVREWRQAVLRSLVELRKGKKDSEEVRRIRDLERELLRKDRALAEVTALLALQKKIQAIWGDEGGGTSGTSGR